MSKKIRITLFLVGFLTVAPSFSSLAQQLNSASLYSLAMTNGGRYVLKYRPNRSTIFPNIAELVKRSDLIVVGKTLGHRSKLRPDGRFITKDYWVRVQESIKGNLPVGQSIVVSLPGGAFRFPDGALVAVVPVDEKSPQDRQIYVFFLKAKLPVAVFSGYLLASETQGLFGLTNGIVDPADTVGADPIVVKYHGMRAPDFLREIHKAIPPVIPGGGIIP